MGRLKMTGANRSGESFDVTGVLVDPSGASWVCVITDAAGNVVFSARSSEATSVYFPIRDTWVGVNVTTATNLTATYIYY